MFLSFFVHVLLAILFPVIAGAILGLYIYLWRNVKDVFEMCGDEEKTEAEDKGMPPIVVVGNKCDLENERNVTYEEGQELTKRLGETAVFFEASAKTNINVDEVCN